MTPDMKELPAESGRNACVRSARRDVRNPVLRLPGVAALQDLDVATQATIAVALRDIQRDARERADKSWRTHKAPMALYWKAVGVYAGHIARILASATTANPIPDLDSKEVGR